MRRRSPWGYLLLLLALVLAPAAATAQQLDAEGAIKATFLYRFASFVQWPTTAFASEEAPLLICVSGDGNFAELVEAAAQGQRIGGRSVEVHRFAAVPTNSGCHIIYLAGARDQTIGQALEVLRGQPILTVTDQRHGRTRGMVHFVISQERVRFHVDRGSAEASGLRLSSRLLQVALSVRGGGAGQP